MRVMTIATAALLMIGLSAIPASADHDPSPQPIFSSTEELSAGTAALWWVGAGVTQSGAACDSGSSLQGIDGFWYDLEEEGLVGDGHRFVLTADDFAMDVDMLLYDQGCNRIEAVADCYFEHGVFIVDELTFLGDCNREEGAIPSETHFLLVQNFFGAGNYTLEIYD